jgi:tetratricopeptide (TPR) repeat protein
MTGKVKRISRDNLDRLVEVLKSSHEALTTADEGDVYATRSEQTRAANLLVMRETEKLFIASQRFETYEQLLKATLHPDLTLQQLAIMYNQLLIVSAMQRKFDDARLMGERCIDYASRCGDIAHEIAARTGLAIIDAEQGLLADSRRKLELLVDMQESVGAGMRHRCNIMLNLGTVYRFLGEMKKSADMANQTIEYHAEHSRYEFAASAYKSMGLLARDIGHPREASSFFEVAVSLLKGPTFTRELAELGIYLLEVRSLLGETGLDGELDALLKTLRGFTYFGDNHYISAAGILRREMMLQDALNVVQEGLSSPSTRRYERALLLQEQARITLVEGSLSDSMELLDQANKIFKACGMSKRICEDASLEVGQQFQKAAGRIKLKWIPYQANAKTSA